VQPDSKTVPVVGPVRMTLRLEGLAMFALAVAVYARSGASWGTFAALFLVPDLSFAGYLAGPRVGAISYNTLHSELGPLMLGLATLLGVVSPTLQPLALIWAAHVGIDRALGYGLKYASAFGDTHLGHIGKNRQLALAASDSRVS
jgi:Domain of unknown function (DUF4260)